MRLKVVGQIIKIISLFFNQLMQSRFHKEQRAQEEKLMIRFVFFIWFYSLVDSHWREETWWNKTIYKTPSPRQRDRGQQQPSLVSMANTGLKMIWWAESSVRVCSLQGLTSTRFWPLRHKPSDASDGLCLNNRLRRKQSTSCLHHVTSECVMWQVCSQVCWCGRRLFQFQN